MKHLWFVMVLLLGGVAAIAHAANENPAPPKDAMWTINCKTFTGPMRVEAAIRARDAVKKLTGWKEWYVIHQEEGESTLFYGYYKVPLLRDLTGGDTKEAEQGRKDLRKIKELRDTEGNSVFRFAFPTEISRPGSEGPPELDIRNTPADRYWSLIVGIYRDNPDYKKAAVEAVKVLRKERAEAYYLHGPTSSLVCIGAWPRSALKEQETDVAAEPEDPDTIIKVYNIPLPENAITDYVQDGKRYKIFAPKVEIVDPTMKAAVDHYPYFHTNGEVLGKRRKDRSGKERVVPNPSQLLIIPRKDQAFGKSEDPARPAPPPMPDPLPVRPKDEPGTGKLKSLD